MATLVLKQFRCLEESDEVGDDSPYFVVFEGNPSRTAAEADLVVVRRESWDNEISSGSLRSPEAVIAKEVGTNHVVLCALMEEDDDCDIAGAALGYVRNWMRAVFDAYRASGSASAADIAKKLKPEFRRALGEARSDDDILGVVHVPVTTADGLLPLRYFYGDGGCYRVRFETTP
jgi:hypothetical protein